MSDPSSAHADRRPAHPRPRPDQALRRVHRRRRASTSTSRRARASASSGPTAPARPVTMRMIGVRLAGHRRRRCSILGLDPGRDGPRIRGRLGVVPQQDTLDTELTVRENLVIYGRYFGLERSEAARAGRRAARVRPAHRARERQGRAAVGRDEAPPDDRPVADQRARRSCSSTSRRPASTRRPATCSGTGCTGSSSAA